MNKTPPARLFSGKGLSIKTFLIMGRGFVQCRHFVDKVEERVLQIRTSDFLMQKTSDLSIFLVCPREQGGKGC